MNDQTTFRRVAAISAILATLLELATFIVLALAVAFRFVLIADQNALIAFSDRAVEVYGWGEILGIFGYCLLFLPAALHIWRGVESPEQTVESTAAG